MNNIFLLGDWELTTDYIKEYIKTNNFEPLEIQTYSDRIKIEEARDIKKSLGYRVKTKKLFIFSCDITIEAQNALLKNIEEASNNIHFIFISDNEDALLPTVKSRCLLVRLGSNRKDNPDILKFLKEICRSRGNWENIDALSTFIEKTDLSEIVPALRTLLLENIESSDCTYYYIYCKKMIATLPLVTHNNMNRRLAVESVFV